MPDTANHTGGLYSSNRGGHGKVETGQEEEAMRQNIHVKDVFIARGRVLGTQAVRDWWIRLSGMQGVGRCVKWILERGHKGLVDKAVRYDAMRLHQIGGEQSYKVTADRLITKLKPKVYELELRLRRSRYLKWH